MKLSYLVSKSGLSSLAHKSERPAPRWKTVGGSTFKAPSGDDSPISFW
jgi:hypothetical protein